MTDRERDEETGRWVRTFKLDDFFQALKELNGDGVGTREVANNVGCTQELARKRLHELKDEGRVRHKKFGRSLVWYPTEKE